MKVRAVILAGGEGTRLGVLTATRTKPAVPFAGKYRIVDFALSNSVNSGIFDVMIVAQYRPHSLIEHIGAGGPWDLNRDFTGGVRIFTPFKAQTTGWFVGTADAVQQNFSFIKHGNPDLILILSGDHIYTMDYQGMIARHIASEADVTIATIKVPENEASRFGIVSTNSFGKITSLVEKPVSTTSTLASMGVYLFNRDVLEKILWQDHLDKESFHDFGQNILPNLVAQNPNVYAYSFDDYWVDVGTVASYWQAQMDLLNTPPPLDLYNRNWVIHTRTEERPPAKINRGAMIEDSLISNGCIIEAGAKVIKSILSPGVVVKSGALVQDSIILTDSMIDTGSILQRAIIDKRVQIGKNACVGGCIPSTETIGLTMIGKNSILPDKMTVESGGMIYNDVVPDDYSASIVHSGDVVHTRRQPYEV
jgi:glucose-1-phosphate adenylyltransferase